MFAKKSDTAGDVATWRVRCSELSKLILCTLAMTMAISKEERGKKTE